MRDKRLQQVHTALAFLRSVIMSGEPMTNEVRNAIDDSIYNIKNVEENLKDQLILSGVSKRYFLFECINADRQKLKKLIIAPDRETAIADIETNYSYVTKWFSSEELNVC